MLSTIWWILVIGGLLFAVYWVWKVLAVVLTGVFLWVILPIIILALLSFGIWVLITGIAQVREHSPKRLNRKKERISKKEREKLLAEIAKEDDD